MFRCGILLLSFLAPILAQAEDENPLQESALERYRSESNYGPEDAVLGEAFPHDQRLELSLGLLSGPFSSLYKTLGATGSAVFHISRRHAIEPVWLSLQSSNLSDYVRGKIAAFSSTADRAATGVEAPSLSYAASYLFSPYYAKMHLTERQVAHFDVYFGLGFGLVKTNEIRLNEAAGPQHSRFATSLSTGLRFLMHDRWAFRLELRDLVHNLKNFDQENLTHNLNLGLTGSVFFKGF